jgi:hypothetical protein
LYVWLNSYAAPLYVDMKKSVYKAPADEDPVEAEWEHEEEEDEEEKIFIGKVCIPSALLIRLGSGSAEEGEIEAMLIWLCLVECVATYSVACRSQSCFGQTSVCYTTSTPNFSTSSTNARSIRSVTPVLLNRFSSSSLSS